MKKLYILLLAVFMCASLSGCGEKELQTSDEGEASSDSISGDTQADKAEAESDEETAAYPFEDEEGRTHYQIYLNGSLIETDHDAYSYPEEPDGAYYPIVEILSQMGVECLFDEQIEALATRVNGQVITCRSDKTDIVIGKTTLGGTAPEYLDGCFYVPSFVFMHIIDAVVDFNSDRSGVTITTDTVIDASKSGTDGLSISSQSVFLLGEPVCTGSEACPTCGGTGRAVCTLCSGTGSSTQYSQTRDPISGQYAIRSTRVFCSRCGGSGRAVCPTCGGTGRK
ncbi:MAG: hypothetical protein VB078_07895 [Clostridiaceae bacterium]|nr:hypothetical protein [Clostridiaceae bacterium]